MNNLILANRISFKYEYYKNTKIITGIYLYCGRHEQALIRNWDESKKKPTGYNCAFCDELVTDAEYDQAYDMYYNNVKRYINPNPKNTPEVMLKEINKAIKLINKIDIFNQDKQLLNKIRDILTDI